MARYIDADKLKGMFNGARPVGCAMHQIIDEVPTADVAPRAELDRVARELERVEALYFAKDTQLENAKAEVAKEIFEEIEEYTATWCGDYLISIEKLDELKKKYTGEERNNR